MLVKAMVVYLLDGVECGPYKGKRVPKCSRCW